jgi:hypothetical protein
VNRNICRNRGFALGQMDRLDDSTFKRMFRVYWSTFDEILVAIEPFSDHSGGILDGCVLAMDGFAVLTRQPYDKEVKYKKDYRYHKGSFAIVVLVGYDTTAILLLQVVITAVVQTTL